MHKPPREKSMHLVRNKTAINRANAEGIKMSNAAPECHRNLALQFETGTADRLIARRNTLVGLWAGAQESRAVYALELMVHGMTDSGHDDVVDTIMRDFAKQGIPIIRGQILVQLSKNHHLVTTQRLTTD